MIRILLVLLFFSTAAVADIPYYPDPVYKKFGDADHSPIEDMVDFAKQGDVRAQFILGDLYSKGKGGMPKDLKEARHWFGESAIHGYAHSFLRLAALAKHDNNPLEAWQWYTLAIDALEDDRRRFAVEARKELVDAAKLDSKNIAAARGAMKDWEDARDDRLRAEKKLAREKAQLEKEQVKKFAETKQQKQQPPNVRGVKYNE